MPDWTVVFSDIVCQIKQLAGLSCETKSLRTGIRLSFAAHFYLLVTWNKAVVSITIQFKDFVKPEVWNLQKAYTFEMWYGEYTSKDVNLT
jgi:hypothetical protein